MNAADLDFYANVAELIGALTIVGGGAFAIVQLIEFRRQRRDLVAVELMRSFYNPEFSRSVALIRGLPDAVSSDDLRARGPEYEQAAHMICMMYETMGLLVFHRIASFELAQELTGGLIEVLWRKLHVWVDGLRLEQSHPRHTEWFQWLAMQVSKRVSVGEPAYLAHRDWEP